MSESDYSDESTSDSDDYSDESASDSDSSNSAFNLNYTLAKISSERIDKLDLSYMNIGATGAIPLAEAFKVNSTITKVELQTNIIGDIGSSALAEALKVNPLFRNSLLLGKIEYCY